MSTLCSDLALGLGSAVADYDLSLDWPAGIDGPTNAKGDKDRSARRLAFSGRARGTEIPRCVQVLHGAFWFGFGESGVADGKDTLGLLSGRQTRITIGWQGMVAHHIWPP